MQCLLTIVLDVFSQILAPCIKAFHEGSEKVRCFQARAETAEKRCTELEEKNRAYESQIQTLLARITVLVAALLWTMILPKRVAMPLDLVALGAAFGDQLLRVVENLRVYGSQQIPLAITCLVQLVERARNGISSWKSVPEVRSFSTSQ